MPTLSRHRDPETAKRDAQEVIPHLHALPSLVLINAQADHRCWDRLARPPRQGHRSRLSQASAVGARGRLAIIFMKLSESTSSVSHPLPPLLDPSRWSDNKSLLDRIQALYSSLKPTLKEGRARLADEFFPGERRECWIWCGKKVCLVSLSTAVLTVIQGDRRVSNAQRLPVRSLASWYHRRVGGARKDRKGVKEGVGLLPAATLARDSYLRFALTLLRPLLDGVANASLDPYFATVNVLVTDAAKDEVLMRLWINVGAYSTRLWSMLHRYVSKLSLRIRSTRRSHKVSRDLDGVNLPTLVDKVGYVPIACVEYTGYSFGLVVENLTLSGRHLFLDLVESQPWACTRTCGTWRFRTAPRGSRRADLAGVVLGGEGLTATVSITSSKDTSSVFRVARFRVRVGSLELELGIRDSKRDLLYEAIKPLATRLIKKQIQKALADAIRTSVEYIDVRLVGVRDRMAEAKASDEMREQDDVSSTASNRPSNSQLKVVIGSLDSLLPDSRHPAGWVNGCAEEQLAGHGYEWRSDEYSTSTRPKRDLAP
ncbi:hypothetical protein B0H13DRAFT_2307465 [Mycena leptocephala]|nr:hypothetical protein B0H13DRAFT_2307465 [Mycena leptocephala]